MAFVVGLTGGIGSGKSSAAKAFAELGAGVVDTDVIAHYLTGPAMPAVGEIASQIGPEFVLPNGSLDRAKLRSRVFSDPVAKAKLEAILHPLIRSRAEEEIRERENAPYVLLVVPLLLETGHYRALIDQLLVVDCTEQLQIQRTMQRSGQSEDEVRAIMANQTNRDERLRHADNILTNNGTQEELLAQISLLHQRYLKLARSKALQSH